MMLPSKNLSNFFYTKYKASDFEFVRTSNMKKTRISIMHQLEKTQHHYMLVNTDKLTSFEVDRVKRMMSVEMVLVNGRLYK